MNDLAVHALASSGAALAILADPAPREKPPV
jgi:hypothetical protein